jgi:hypothetical protein
MNASPTKKTDRLDGFFFRIKNSCHHSKERFLAIGASGAHLAWRAKSSSFLSFYLLFLTLPQRVIRS